MARFRPLLCKQTHLEDKFSYIARNSTHRGQIGSLGDRAPERTLPLWAARNTRTPTGTLPAPLILVDWFEELLGCKWPHYRLSNAHIRFGHPASAGFPAGFKFLLATVRHYVWVARNSWHFEGTRPDPQVLVEKIESTFLFVSKVQQRVLRPTFYEEEWFAGGVL